MRTRRVVPLGGRALGRRLAERRQVGAHVLADPVDQLADPGVGQCRGRPRRSRSSRRAAAARGRSASAAAAGVVAAAVAASIWASSSAWSSSSASVARSSSLSMPSAKRDRHTGMAVRPGLLLRRPRPTAAAPCGGGRGACGRTLRRRTAAAAAARRSAGAARGLLALGLALQPLLPQLPVLVEQDATDAARARRPAGRSMSIWHDDCASGSRPATSRMSSLSRRTITSSSTFLARTGTPRQKRCGSRISSSAEKLFEWPLCGVAERKRRCSNRAGQVADGPGDLASRWRTSRRSTGRRGGPRRGSAASRRGSRPSQSRSGPA